jgi:hypothetical protein
LCSSTTGIYIKDKDPLVSKVHRNASKNKGHYLPQTTHSPQQNFCKLNIGTVVTEEGTKVKLFFVEKWKRASTVYGHTALCCFTPQLYCLSAWWERKIRGTLEIHEYYRASRMS